MAKDPYRYFRIEARELMDQLGSGVLDLEKGSTGGELVPRLLRLAHTLKGAARVVKQAEIADLIHGVEGMLEPHRDAATQAPPEKVDRILLALDAINTRLTQLAAAPDGAPASPSPALPHPLNRWMNRCAWRRGTWLKSTCCWKAWTRSAASWQACAPRWQR